MNLLKVPFVYLNKGNYYFFLVGIRTIFVYLFFKCKMLVAGKNLLFLLLSPEGTLKMLFVDHLGNIKMFWKLKINFIVLIIKI
jgi:hypothetical protein